MKYNKRLLRRFRDLRQLTINQDIRIIELEKQVNENKQMIYDIIRGSDMK